MPRRVVWLWLEEELGGREGVTEEVFLEQVNLEMKRCSCWGKDESTQRCENLWDFGETSNTTCDKTSPIIWCCVVESDCVCELWGRRGGRKGSAAEAGNESVGES